MCLTRSNRLFKDEWGPSHRRSVRDNGGNPAGGGGAFLLRHPHLQTLEAVEDELELVWGVEPAVVGGESGVWDIWTRQGQRDTQKPKMAPDAFMDYFHTSLVS